MTGTAAAKVPARSAAIGASAGSGLRKSKPSKATSPSGRTASGLVSSYPENRPFLIFDGDPEPGRAHASRLRRTLALFRL